MPSDFISPSTIAITAVALMDGSTTHQVAVEPTAHKAAALSADSERDHIISQADDAAADSEADIETQSKANGIAVGKESAAAPPEGQQEEQEELGQPRELRATKSILKSQGSGDSNPALRRTVSWHDFEGRDLHTVREFVPSEHDDEEIIEEPEKKACCVIC